MKNLNELRKRHAALIATARKILDKAEEEERALNTEEESEYNKIMADDEVLRSEIDREARIQAEEERLRQPQTDPHRPDPNDPPAPELRFNQRPEYRDAYRRMLAAGFSELTSQEQRAMQADQANIGGFWVMPEQMAEDLIKFIDDMLFIRRLGTVLPVPNAESLGVPSFDTDVDDADWTVELGTGSEDSAARVGKRQLTPHPLAKLIKLSQTWLRKVPPDRGEAFIRDRLGYKIGVAEEKGFLTGSGSGQPLGLFTASSDGISTGRDVSTGNTTTSIQFDGLKEAFWNEKEQYRRTGEWLFSRPAMKQIDKLKDGEGRYILQPNQQQGPADVLLGRPVNISEFVPSTFTTGLYVGMFGDFSFYYIADAMDIRIQRLVELYAATNQVGLISRLEVDGMPVLEEAFSRVTLA